MSRVDERIERLIGRRLDGALNEAEALELDLALRDSPAARQMLADYDRIDRLAVGALRGEVFECQAVSSEAVPIHRFGSRQWLWYVPGAIAATLALMLWWSSPTEPTYVATRNSFDRQPIATPHGPTMGEIRPATHGFGFEDQTVNRNAVWVVAGNGKIYLIERQTADVLEKPGTNFTGWSTEGGI